jgi:hypothetical protein
MTADAIAQILLILWMSALGCLLIRLLILRLHYSHLLFTVSCGLDLVFGIATLQHGIASPASASLGLLGDTMDVFLTPSVAAELFGSTRALEAYPGRQLAPLILTLLAGIGVELFLASSPDNESFQSASVLAFVADTMVTLLVVSYVIRKARQQNVAVERNSLWLRRLFAVELVASAIRSLIGPFLASPQVGVVDILFFSICLVATAVCTFALRKTIPAAPASL